MKGNERKWKGMKENERKCREKQGNGRKRNEMKAKMNYLFWRKYNENQ